MKGKYFAYIKKVRPEYSFAEFVYVLSPSAITFLWGNFWPGNAQSYTPRTSFDSLAKLEKKVDELRSGELRAEVVDSRLSLFSSRKSVERYEGNTETIYRTPMREVIRRPRPLH